MRKTLRFTLVLSLLLLSGGCVDYKIPLGGGYEITRFNSGTYGLVYGDDILSGPGPMMYSSVDGIVAGYVDCEDEAAPSACGNSGYFVVNTILREHHTGLSVKYWELSLREYGVNAVPILKRPQGHHAWFTFLQK